MFSQPLQLKIMTMSTWLLSSSVRRPVASFCYGQDGMSGEIMGCADFDV